MAEATVDREELLRLAQAMIEDLRANGSAPGLALGDTAPDFDLPDATGGRVRLSDRLAEGPVVVVFYRGAWCPICNLHLRDLQEALGEIRSHGASLVAISPQAPDESLEFSHKLALGFDVLSDLDQSVIRTWRLQFALPNAMHDAYRAVGMGLDGHNADGSWDLPIPATFVLDRAGVIRARHVDPNYRERMHSSDVILALEQISEPS